MAGCVRAPDVHDVDGQVAGRAEHLVCHRGPVQQARPARPALRPDHELASVGLACGLDQPGSNVAGPDLKERPAQLVQQLAILLELGRRRLVEVVDRPDVHPVKPGIGQPGEVGGLADEPLVDGRPF